MSAFTLNTRNVLVATVVISAAGCLALHPSSHRSNFARHHGLKTVMKSNNGARGLSTVTSNPKNVLGEDLQICSVDPQTGYFRNGRCETGPSDTGTHTVCARVTEEFLEFTKTRGNDLSTPMPAYRFPGLKPGDGWCLCALRWKEAEMAGNAPPVVLEATHSHTLDFIDMATLQAHSTGL